MRRMRKALGRHTEKIDRLLKDAEYTLKYVQECAETHHITLYLLFPNTAPYEGDILDRIKPLLDPKLCVEDISFYGGAENAIYILGYCDGTLSESHCKILTDWIDEYLEKLLEIFENIMRDKGVEYSDSHLPYVYATQIAKPAIAALYYGIGKRLRISIYDNKEETRQLGEEIKRIEMIQQEQNCPTIGTLNMIPRFHYIVERMVETYYEGRIEPKL